MIRIRCGIKMKENGVFVNSFHGNVILFLVLLCIMKQRRKLFHKLIELEVVVEQI